MTVMSEVDFAELGGACVSLVLETLGVGEYVTISTCRFKVAGCQSHVVGLSCGDNRPSLAVSH